LGIPLQLSINSKVPLKDGAVLFADPINNCVFPALFEKALAKAYGSYESISDDPVELL
jgi:hypothetical protein